MHDDATRHSDGRDLHHRVAVITGPGFEVERRHALQLVGVDDSPRRTADKHTPALAEGLLDPIDLEADHRLASQASRPSPRRY